MNILGLSTSTARATAALVQGEEATTIGALAGFPCVAYAETDLLGRAERIFDAVEKVLAEAGTPREHIHLVACDIGPGSFTGVRVGVASAKGIALALGVPLVGVVSLRAMAVGSLLEGEARGAARVVPLIDAKKGEVFAAAYDTLGTEVTPPCTLPVDPIAVTAIAQIEGGRSIVIGEIAARLGLPPPLACGSDASAHFPHAAWVARLALLGANSMVARDPAELEPLYVRPPDVTLPKART